MIRFLTFEHNDKVHAAATLMDECGMRVVATWVAPGTRPQVTVYWVCGQGSQHQCETFDAMLTIRQARRGVTEASA